MVCSHRRRSHRKRENQCVSCLQNHPPVRGCGRAFGLPMHSAMTKEHKDLIKGGVQQRSSRLMHWFDVYIFVPLVTHLTVFKWVGYVKMGQFYVQPVQDLLLIVFFEYRHILKQKWIFFTSMHALDLVTLSKKKEMCQQGNPQ